MTLKSVNSLTIIITLIYNVGGTKQFFPYITVIDAQWYIKGG